MTLILDGVLLADARASALATRSASIRERRGTPPRLVLIAFAEAGGRVPHTERKIRAGTATGIEVVPLIIPAGMTTGAARDAITRASAGADGVFLQFPFPTAIDAEALTAAIPEDLDVDVMTPGRIRRYLSGEDELPPVTVSAGVALLDAYGVDVRGVDGVVVSEPGPFAAMFREELARRGAGMRETLAPDGAHASAVLNEAGLVIVSVGKPGAVDASALATGAVAIDVGYFNAGGRGDIRGDASHLAALAPVPGGIGPMTVSMLIERTILFAERSVGAGTADES